MLVQSKRISIGEKEPWMTENLNTTPTIHAFNFGVHPSDTKSQKSKVNSTQAGCAGQGCSQPPPKANSKSPKSPWQMVLGRKSSTVS